MAINNEILIIKRLTADVDVGGTGGTLTDLTDLSIPVYNGIEVCFTVQLCFTGGNNVGMRCGINGPTGTLIIGGILSNDVVGANYASITALNTVIFAQTAGSTVNKNAFISGSFIPTADGTLTVQATNEGSGAMVINSGSVAIFSTPMLLADSTAITEDRTIVFFEPTLFCQANDTTVVLDTPRTASDNFNRTESPLSTGWSALSGLAGQCLADGANMLGNTASANCASVYTGASFRGITQFASIVSSTHGTDSGGVVVFASASVAQAYVWAVGNADSTLYKYDGSFNALGANTGTVVTVGHTYRLEAVDDGAGTVTLSVYDNGSLVTTRTDSTSPYTSGSPGAFAFSNVDKWDTWSGGDLASPVTITFTTAAGPPAPNLFDSSAVTESQSITFVWTLPTISDASPVTESFTITGTMSLTTFDASAITESQTFAGTMSLATSDAPTATDYVTLPFYIPVADASAITEALAITFVWTLPTISDDAIVDELSAVTIGGVPGVDLTVDVNDAPTADESSTVLLTTLFPSVEDTSAPDEAVTVYWNLTIPAGDTTITDESVELFVHSLFLDIADAPTADDEGRIAMPEAPATIDTGDDATVTDDLAAMLLLNFALEDTILMDDAPTLNFTQPPLGVVAFESLTATSGKVDALTAIT